MKVTMFSVFDQVAKVYLPPFVSINPGMAQRLLEDWASDPKSVLAVHPQDFVVMRVGEFDDHTGEIVAAPPVLVFRVFDVLRKEVRSDA